MDALWSRRMKMKMNKKKKTRNLLQCRVSIRAIRYLLPHRASVQRSIYSSMFFRWFGLEMETKEWQRKTWTWGKKAKWIYRKTRSNVDAMKKWDVWERGINYILSDTELWCVWWAKIIYCTVASSGWLTMRHRQTRPFLHEGFSICILTTWNNQLEIRFEFDLIWFELHSALWLNGAAAAAVSNAPKW